VRASNHEATVGAPPWANAASYVYDGSTEAVVYDYDAAFDLGGTDQFTVSLWVYASSITFLGGMACMAISNDGDYQWIVHWYNTLQRIQARINASGKTTLESVTVMALDAWHHVVATYDGGDFTLYVDDTEEATKPKTGNFVASGASSHLHIGRWYNSTKYFSGNLDEVAVLSEARDASWVTAAYNGGTPTDLSGESGLVVYQRSEVWAPVDTADASYTISGVDMDASNLDTGTYP